MSDRSIMNRTVRVAPGYLGIALDDLGFIDGLLYGSRDVFNNQGISAGWRVVLVDDEPFTVELLLAKSKGRNYYELKFEKRKQKKANWMNTSTWACKQGLGKICFDSNKGFPDLLRLKTESNGWTMEKATKACREVPDKVLAIRAGDDESYDLFAPMFDDLILRYHNIKVKQNIARKEQYSVKDIPTLPDSAASSIKSTRIRAARNLAGYPFTNNMTKGQRLDIEATLKSVFKGFTDKRLKGTYYPMKNMSSEKRRELIDAHYIYTLNSDPILESSGCYDDWPDGRGIFINNDRTKGVFIVWVGEEDHMRIMAMKKGSDVQAVWDLFYSGLEAVHRGVQTKGKEFSFKSSHGYLATSPTNLGTGMRASVLVDLPQFETKHELEAYVKTKGWPIDVRTTLGENDEECVGTIYDISNKERLGSDCNAQIKAMVDGVASLLTFRNGPNKREVPNSGR